MVGQWAPDSEKGVLNTLVYGVNVGTIVAMPLNTFLCDSGLFGGWVISILHYRIMASEPFFPDTQCFLIILSKESPQKRRSFGPQALPNARSNCFRVHLILNLYADFSAVLS
ncbi:hypothetical protein CDAR_47051 [Caerostris darwini]|uniref:Uncharacterized protein n=1 Tax=Caerostris darwini TaxID=1538125 RepID=A0AAV4UA50_9ARAC|nr:hypothetical protein CDAR_47051 [Caerostris darwini]